MPEVWWSDYYTWAYFEVKQLDACMRYQWYKINVFTRWIPSTKKTIILLFDAPTLILERIPTLLIPDSTRINDPFWVYAGLAAEITRLEDSAVWAVRNQVRAIETERQPVKPRPNYRLLHDIARHAIHVSETLDVATQTMKSIMLEHEHFITTDSVTEKDVSRNIHRQLLFSGNMIESLRHRSVSNEKRLLNEIQLAYNIVAQYDAGISVEIGHAARSDSAAMKTISFVTLAFLPPTFISTIFSMSFFDYSVDSGWTVSGKFWVYWAFAVPITIVSFLVWKYWHKVFPSLRNEQSQVARDSQEELLNTAKALKTRAISASGLSQFVPPEYAGFGIESSNLFSFTGASEANKFTIQLVQNLADYSGRPGSLRIGGNTQDNFLYQDDMDDFTVKENPSPVGQGDYASDRYIIGPRYFEAISRLPSNTPITFGLNMAYYQADYLDQITNMASAAVRKLTSLDLVAFEIGNEPDLYLENHFRNSSWTGQMYVEERVSRAHAIYERVLRPAGLAVDFFEGPCSASTIGTTFEIPQLVVDGIQTDVHIQGANNLPYLRAWNQHDYLYFINISDNPLTLEWVMNLDNTETQFRYWSKQVGIALATGLPYHLREMASVGPVGGPGVSDTFGAALWTLNLFLYGATLNISSVQIHMTDNSLAAPWQPMDRDGVARHVRPSYYAFAAMAQLIGSGNGTTRVAALSSDDVPEEYRSNVRMYAGYGGGALTSVVIINSKQSNESEDRKGSLTVTLSLGGFKGQKLYLSYLTADGADSKNGTVWNGMRYSDEDGTPSIVDDSVQTVTVGNDGMARVTVRDSQAMIAYIGSRLGSRQVNLNKSITDIGGPSGGSGSTGTASSSESVLTKATITFTAELTTTSATMMPTAHSIGNCMVGYHVPAMLVGVLFCVLAGYVIL
ncbi:hypothetical protein VMCG_00791 [Cytospora schulzeri]|uniref:Beta-glucuronidase C-terminal domain-containing protein n=1 Tax=Cytospora schulzeri TaxID=448051 RepID=A0A423X9L7_9PEZI|nr:hypothetical protein VMCG_00791 [Valsa malicola]